MDILHVLERGLSKALRLTRELSRRFGASDDELERQSQVFWEDGANPDLGTVTHQRGQGPFEDDSLWWNLGRRHHDLCERALTWVGRSLPVDAIVEWGAGGGMNAVHLAPLAGRYYAVDVNRRTLDACEAQTRDVDGLVIPVLIDVAEPESALASIETCDLVLSTYVFEVFPSASYGLRVMRTIFDMLRPSGVAMIQVRYRIDPVPPPVSRRSYARSWLRLTSYTIPEFWSACREIGFEPLFVTLVPEEPELDETRYAYFALRKP